MKLSIIILCWNDLKVIENCLDSIYATEDSIQFEVIVSDNGSTDGSIEFVRKSYPQVRVIENGVNLRFAKANNVGIRASQGDYVLILNPDTLIHVGTLDQILRFADKHPEAGAFGCKVLNFDGSHQRSGRPFPTTRSEWIVALNLRPLAHLSKWFVSDNYPGWAGETQRTVDWLSGCFILVRGELLKRLGGFDEQFFYYYEDMDLCHRIWNAGYSVLYTPEVAITHLGGQSTNKRFPRINFALDSQITRYRYFYKYCGRRGVRRCRQIALVSLSLRRLGHGLAQIVEPTQNRKDRLELLRTVFEWNWQVDPVRLVEDGKEPDVGAKLVGRILER